MSKRLFTANSWLQANLKGSSALDRASLSNKDSYNVLLEHQDSSSSSAQAFNSLPSSLSKRNAGNRDELPPLPHAGHGLHGSHEMNESFLPKKYFIPGWSGGSLFSRPAVAIKKLQEELWKDALYTFKSSSNFPKTMSAAIHKEFKGSACETLIPSEFQGEMLQSIREKIKDLHDYQLFWSEVKKPQSEYGLILKAFLELYCFKVATIYLLKLKFLVSYSEATSFSYTINHIVNPSTFINHLFTKGSSQEINCESLKMNQYSWYRPSGKIAQRLEELTKSFSDVSTTQLMKLCSYRDIDSSSSSLKFNNKNYSHALSHKSFGKFINELLVFFPLWNQYETFHYPRKQSLAHPDVLNTKFVGDHIESLGQGHWLAQESNLAMDWSEIICPDFSTEDQSEKCFIKTSQELQFLNFLVTYSKDRRISTRDFVLQVTREKFNRSKINMSPQISLFTTSEQQSDLLYDRIVLNLGHLPKKNPHHFLLSKIQEQKDSLATEAQLLVLTNQKIFVPSQSKKVKALLKDFKIEAIFNFEKLKGRGEVSNYAYILSKRNPFARNKDFLNMDPASLVASQKLEQESCFSFRWHGELTLFSKFDILVDELFNFFSEKSSQSASIYQRGLGHELSFEFHQDAIIDGKLLSSLNEDNENITHPQFFKNLTLSCSPFDTFFSIIELQDRRSKKSTKDFLGISQSSEQSAYSSVLIIDLRNAVRPQIEIISPESYLAKRDEYGNAYFQYYGLTPKVKNLNLNLLREFLETDLGRQVTQICLSGGPSKMKGKLKSLLLPNFFKDGRDLSTLNPEKYWFFNINEEELLNTHPEELHQKVLKEYSKIDYLKDQQIWLYLSLIGHLKLTLRSTLEKINDDPHKEFNFTNPLLIEALTSLTTYTIYPNEEVYTELKIEHKDELECPLTQLKLIENGEDCSLHLYGPEKVLIEFHAEKETLQFIQFILSQASGYPLLQILQNLEIPKHDELKSVLTEFNQVKTTLHDTYNEVHSKITRAFTKQIAQV